MILSFIFTIFVYLEAAVIVTIIVTLPLFKNNIVGCYRSDNAQYFQLKNSIFTSDHF